MSPLARSAVPMKTHDQSSDSDCQAPSKRFKPDCDSNFPDPNLRFNQTGASQKTNSLDKENHMNCSNSSQEASAGRDPAMAVEEPSDNMDVRMNCQDTFSETGMVGCDADIAKEIESLID